MFCEDYPHIYDVPPHFDYSHPYVDVDGDEDSWHCCAHCHGYIEDGDDFDTLIFDGTQYYFCDEVCKEKFLKKQNTKDLQFYIESHLIDTQPSDAEVDNMLIILGILTAKAERADRHDIQLH